MCCRRTGPVSEALEDQYGDLGVVQACLFVHGMYEEVVDVGDQKDAKGLLQEPSGKYASLRSIEVKTYPALTHLVSHDFPELLVMMKEFVCFMETIG